jgi:hypothetical protein
LLDDLGHGFQKKVQEHNIDNGAPSRERCADPDSRLTKFRDRGIPQSFFSELCPEPTGLLPIATPRANPLANVKNGGIAAHFFPQGFNPCVYVTNRPFAHRLVLGRRGRNYRFRHRFLSLSIHFENT